LRAVDIIEKKRDGKELSQREIDFLIRGYTQGEIPDYQISAVLMAIYFNGLTVEETVNLTFSMIESGDKVDLTSLPGIKVDKHSTGGVGDKTTLVVAPLVAAAGLTVAKMSGKGLGHTGGTIDKLLSIDGIRLELATTEFLDIVSKTGLIIAGQSGNLVPADKKLYSLRDVTGTVRNVSLIASSIMSKKIASGADSILLDVKSGTGAFFKSLDESREAAELMVNIGKKCGKSTVAVISNMNEPLGEAIGNALEVKEAIYTLLGNGPKDLEELSINLGAHMLLLGKIARTLDEGKEIIIKMISSQKGYEKLIDMVKALRGDIRQIEEPDRLNISKEIYNVLSKDEGYINRTDALKIGYGAMVLGAGRRTKEEEPDLSVGVVANKKVGDYVYRGDILATIYWVNPDTLESAKEMIEGAYRITKEKVSKPEIILDTVS
jgi:pyrimidine-nucleoside phosphorylase